MLIASHRLSALPAAPTPILVLDRGRLVDHGTPRRAGRAPRPLPRHLVGPAPGGPEAEEAASMSDAGLLRRLWPLPPAGRVGVRRRAGPDAGGGRAQPGPALPAQAGDRRPRGARRRRGADGDGPALPGAVVAGYVLQGGLRAGLAWGGAAHHRAAALRRLPAPPRLAQSFLDRQPAGRLLTRATSDVDALGEAFSSGAHQHRARPAADRRDAGGHALARCRG